MGVRALSSTGVDLPVDGVWALVVAVTDSDGCPAAVTPTVAVTLPDDSTAAPTAEAVATGVYRAELAVAQAGRYVARVTTPANGAADFTAFVTATVAASGMPSVTDVSGYLDENSWTDEQIQDALDAESAAQRRVCGVPAAYPDDLRQALLRRVSRNLAMRGQPYATIPDTETPTVVPSRDPEVRRLEAPFRKLVMG